MKLTGEDGGFHHRPHVDESMAIESFDSDLISALHLIDFI